MNKKILGYIIIGVSLFALSGVVTYWLFAFGGKGRKLGPSPVGPTPTGKQMITLPYQKPTVDPSKPKVAACPLNGVLYTQDEADVWTTRRPIAVMIENSSDSRPQSGLSYADIVYEAVAEGGITRFMGVFYCNIASGPVRFAPVRSARIHYVKLVPEYDALYNHVGGAGNCDDPTVAEIAKALCFIRRNKIKDLDQFGLDFKSCHRLTNRLDHEVAYEHTMACYSQELYKVAAKRGWTDVWGKNYVSWKFKADATDRGQSTSIKFNFWKNKADYAVEWQYDPTGNAYLRSTGGQVHMDLDSGQRLTAKVVIVQFVKESGPLDEHLHMYYEVVGKGKALVFQDGEAVEATWTKVSPTGRTRFFTLGGKEIELNKGQIWIELVPTGSAIEYNQ